MEPTSLGSQRGEEVGESDDQQYTQYEPALPNLLHHSWQAHGSDVKYEVYPGRLPNTRYAPL